jgi:hypothetical protein
MGPPEAGDNDSMFLPGMENLDASKRDAARQEDHQEQASTTPPRMSADANPLPVANAGAPAHAPADARPSNGKPANRESAQPPDYVEPLWMRRTKLVIFVMACIYLGIILIILPWNELWVQNGLIHRYPGLRDLAMSNFVRGAITGLGFVNVWLGVWEAVHYRENKK